MSEGRSLVLFCLINLVYLSSSNSVYFPRYMPEKGWIPWAEFEDTVPVTCAAHCNEYFKQFGWCTGFTVDNSSKCSLSSFDYSILQKKESDVPGAATKVYIVRGRENVGKSAFLVMTDDLKTPTIISPNAEAMCKEGGGNVIPPFPTDQYNEDGFRNNAMGLLDPGGLLVLCGGKQLNDSSVKCHYYSMEDEAQVAWESTVTLNKKHLRPAYATVGQKLFIFFGHGSARTIEYFDGATKTVDYLRDVNGDPVGFWNSTQQGQIQHLCAAAVSETEVILSGYYRANFTSQEVYSLDLTTGAWTRLPDLNVKRHNHACGVVTFQGSRVLMVLGGQDRWANQPNSVTNQKTVEVLDLATRSNWTLIGSTPENFGCNKGRVFNSGSDGRVTYVRFSKVMYQLNEATMTWEGTPLSDPDALGITAANYEVVDQKYFPMCRKF